MAGLPSGSKDSKDTPAYLKQGGILWFLFQQAACFSRKINMKLDLRIEAT